ncbi:MAG: GFA family protein [Bradyrhizobium sp.]|uniref:GFA family protein n=1 Tax=Bradyrhizobium sp. TaxID=376 RepID=UPI001211FAA6|nr:GFA family protein [Bradyrhizobium sp.]THD51057.1 MAG: GFA family protein [Bradyrhizobium sp.]
MTVVRGGCLCQSVGFEVDLPFIKFVKCHCSRCRRATGSAFAANAYVLPAAFRWTCGSELVVRFDLPEARSFSTSFCSLCGSPLPHSTRSGREVIIPAGSLMDDPGASPSVESCWSSRASWLSDAIDLPTTD